MYSLVFSTNESCLFNAEHSGLKRMDTEAPDNQKMIGPPPLMPWQAFTEWIGMGDEPIVVRTRLERYYLPSRKVGKRLRGNFALLTQQPCEEE